MNDLSKLQILKTCSDTVKGRSYAFEIKDGVLFFWHNGKIIKIYDKDLGESGESGGNWVNYEFFEEKGLPGTFIYFEDGDSGDAPNNIFMKENIIDHTKNNLYLHLTDSSNYLEGVDFYLIEISKNNWRKSKIKQTWN